MNETKNDNIDDNNYEHKYHHGKPYEGMCCLCTMENITEEDGNYGKWELLFLFPTHLRPPNPARWRVYPLTGRCACAPIYYSIMSRFLRLFSSPFWIFPCIFFPPHVAAHFPFAPLFFLFCRVLASWLKLNPDNLHHPLTSRISIVPLSKMETVLLRGQRRATITRYAIRTIHISRQKDRLSSRIETTVIVRSTNTYT